MPSILEYISSCCSASTVKHHEFESMYSFCTQLELKLKDTEEQLVVTKSEAEEAILRCNSFSQQYEVKLEEKEKVIQRLRVTLQKSRVPSIKNGLTKMSLELTQRQKQENEYLKNRCKTLEKTAETLCSENQKLLQENEKLKKSLSKAKMKAKQKASKNREKRAIALMTEWETAVYRCDQVELRRLLPLVEFETRQKALFWFVKFDNVALVKLLLDCETQSPSYIGSIIWYAVDNGSEKVCEELVARKADVNVVDKNGVDLITFCANNTTNHHCRKRLLAILYKADTNRQEKWINDEGEEVELRSYCGVDEGAEDKDRLVHVNDCDSQSQSTESTFK